MAVWVGRRRGGPVWIWGIVAIVFVIVRAMGGGGHSSQSQRHPSETWPRHAPSLPPPGPPEEGVALVIVYDTSASMTDLAPGQGGRLPKYVIGSRALLAVADRLGGWAKGGTAASPRRIDVGLVVFEGEYGVDEVLSLSPLHVDALRQRIARLPEPAGHTPLGTAIERAGVMLLSSRLTKKHVLVITDGESNRGPLPAVVLGELRALAEARQALLMVHVIAFDVDAAVFAPLKDAGATLVSAADEAQLQEKLSFILDEQILLEK